MLKVYLAGPISGLTQKEALGWRGRTREILDQAGYRCVDPMRGHDSRRAEEALRADGHNWPYGPKAVFKRDKHDVERCDVILVNLTAASRVSIFTMMEMAWAEQWNKFILTVMEDGGIAPPPVSDLAWMAGIVDGEGCVYVDKQLSRGGSSPALANPHYQVQLKISMTHRLAVEKCLDVAGFGKMSSQSARDERRKPMWTWKVVGQQAAGVLRMLYPYMLVKKPQAAVAIAMAEATGARRSDSVPAKGQKGFRPKSVDVVAEEARLYELWASAHKGGEIVVPEPDPVRYANLHEHLAVREASSLVVPTLEDAIKYLTKVHNQ